MPTDLGIEMEPMPPTTYTVTFANAINGASQEKEVRDDDPAKALAEARRMAREYRPYGNTRTKISFLAGHRTVRRWMGPVRGYKDDRIPVHTTVPLAAAGDRDG
ncbi:hypothetical protein [Actinomadura violacea]|uniref:Uncharacterized protein n=1 Tax=Actinomadura violacea TaxID=2819934 RepID=A0ABS3RY92_9ACTN|nr:hypothetical protein [Actinomadura violacea]MBO2461722.1 hypothetical protein [Actinomadura violacea]